MARFLILCSTTDGQTVRIAARIAETLEKHGHRVACKALADMAAVDWQDCERLILGASIRYGKHKPEVIEFVKNNREQLAHKRAAFYAVSAVARKAEKRRVENNLYMRKFLQQTGWQPAHIGIFAGRIHYDLYRPLDRFMIRLIMRITKGPTERHANVEFTDWDEVRAFAEACAVDGRES